FNGRKWKRMVDGPTAIGRRKCGCSRAATASTTGAASWAAVVDGGGEVLQRGLAEPAVARLPQAVGADPLGERPLDAGAARVLGVGLPGRPVPGQAVVLDPPAVALEPFRRGQGPQSIEEAAPCLGHRLQ